MLQLQRHLFATIASELVVCRSNTAQQSALVRFAEVSTIKRFKRVPQPYLELRSHVANALHPFLSPSKA